MAVPSNVSIEKMNASFIINKDKSDSQDAILAIQGLPYGVRQVAKIAKIKMDVLVETAPGKPKTAEVNPANLQVSLTTSLAGLGFVGAAPLRAFGIATEKTIVHQLDSSKFEQEEPVVGKFIGKMSLVSVADLKANKDIDAWCAEGYDKQYVMLMQLWSIKADEPEPWTGVQIWGIAGKEYVGRFQFKKGKEVAQARVVYDYKS